MACADCCGLFIKQKQSLLKEEKHFFSTMFNILQFIFATTTLFWVSGIPIEVDGKTFLIDILFSNWFFVRQPDTDYGHPMKPFFIKIPNVWAWADNFVAFGGIFGRFISTLFGTVSPLYMFSINQPLFLQKTSPLYP